MEEYFNRDLLSVTVPKEQIRKLNILRMQIKDFMENENLLEASIFKITGNTLYKYVYKGLDMHSVK